MRLITLILPLWLTFLVPETNCMFLDPVGKAIRFPFPSEQQILGVGGLAYDQEKEIWTACAENLKGTELTNEYPVTGEPRIYKMYLDFQNGSVEFINDIPTFVLPSRGLKLEDISIAPTSSLSYWVVSEAHSNLVKTTKFFSKDFGANDLRTYDPQTFSTSSIVRIDGETGSVLETAEIPAFGQWEPQSYDWDSMQCTGDRPFHGTHAVSIFPSASSEQEYTMIVGYQAALYQDGPTPSEFQGSATRILYYTLTPETEKNETATAKYTKSYRYDTSKLTMKSYQKGSKHFNALFGLLAINETSLLVAECEDFLGFGRAGTRTINRLFYVEIDPSKTVDHCISLLDCNITAPEKHLIWELERAGHLDGIAWGKPLDDGTPTIAFTFENDEDPIGLSVELFSLDIDTLPYAPLWEESDLREYMIDSRIRTTTIFIGIISLLVIIQFFVVRRILTANRVSDVSSENSDPNTERSTEITRNSVTSVDTERVQHNTAIPDYFWELLKKNTESVSGKIRKSIKFRHYALFTAICNSFLLGGVTFGYSGMAFMLRREGIFAEQCACGSFCAAEKEELAKVSTIGFATAIGSRLFIGLFMDSQGPKAAAILCGMISLGGFIIMGNSSSENLHDTFVWAWVLLSIGGSGLHIVGFHFTNLFKGDSKKVASAAISAAFGASSAIFPIWNIFNQSAGVSLQYMATVYSVVVFLVLMNNFLIQPWRKVQPGIPMKLNLKVLDSKWWACSEQRSKPIVLSKLFELMKKFEFWGECLFFSFNLLLLTYFLSTSGAFLYEKGDAKFTTEPNNPIDYLYARLAGWFNAFGFLWYPFIKLMMLKMHWPSKYLALVAANIVVVLIVISVPQLEPQIIAMTVLSFSRLMLFSFHHAYILDKNGIEYFGLLNGVSSFIAAIIGLVNYPLQVMALETSFSISFVPIAICVFLSISFPLILRLRPVLNWAESYAIDPRQLRWPASLEELIKLIKNTEKIRCVGAMHSCAPLVVSDGIIISMDKLNKILEINVKEQYVRVEPGVRVHEVCEAVKPYNLAFGTLGTIDWQTVVGAVMTGTHGGSLTTKSMHAFVDEYTVVRADGSLMTVTSDSNPELFSAMAPCMGVFGVVIEAKVRLVKLEHLEARMEEMPFKEAIATFHDIMSKNKYARVVVYPSLDKATVWTANTIKMKGDAVARGATKSKGYINFRNEHEKAWLEEYLAKSQMKKYGSANKLLRKVMDSQLKRLHHYEGPYNHVLCKERNHGIPHADIEFGFDVSKAADVLNTVRAWCSKTENRVPYYNFEIRTTQQDDAMISVCNGRDTMFIDFQAKSTISSEFFDKMEDLLSPFGYRKHWAKGMCHSKPEYIVSQFPNMKRFIELMEEHDPEGKFRNEHIRLWYQKIKATLGAEDQEFSC